MYLKYKYYVLKKIQEIQNEVQNFGGKKGIFLGFLHAGLIYIT